MSTFKINKGVVDNLESSLSGKSSTDLDNLSQTGEAHFANSALSNSPYTTNRILEILQNINLELNNGTLTLKSGSKTYWCDGSFTPVTTTQDVSAPAITSTYPDGTLFYAWYYETGLQIIPATSVTSVAGTTGSATWNFNTTDNKIYGNGTYYKRTLPVCTFFVSGTSITAIDQIFNGFGYISSTAFILPGVKVTLPDGLNDDGTFNNQIRTTTSVEVSNNIHYNTSGVWSGSIVINPTYSGRSYKYMSCSSRYTIPVATNGYILSENKTFQTDAYGNISSAETKMCCLVDYTCTDGVVTKWKPHFIDSIVNSNMSNISNAGRSYLSGLGAVSSKSEVTSLALGATGTLYNAPSTGYVRLRATGGNYLGISVVGIGAYQSIPSGATLHFWSVLLKKGTQYSLSYDGTLTNHTFISADGEN